MPKISKADWDGLSELCSSPISDFALGVRNMMGAINETDGLHVSLIGYFRQTATRKDDGEVASPVVIAQSPEERDRLEEGRLVGRMQGLDGVYRIEGTMDRKNISFVKGTGPGRILYNGDSVELPEGTYQGEWKFENPELTDGNLKASGRFVLVRTD